MGIPTETVYGLAADVTSPEAVLRIFAVKERPLTHPLIVHIADQADLPRWVERVPDHAWLLARELWPGPLTLVLRSGPAIPAVVTGGRTTVAIRIPDHSMTLDVIRQLGRPIAAPSANKFGRVSPTTAEAVVKEFRDDVNCVLDGGRCVVGLESTILDLTCKVPTILRHGGTPAESLDAILGRPVRRSAAGPARAPGMLAAHYAPSARVVPVRDADVACTVDQFLADGARLGVLGPSRPKWPRHVTVLDTGPDVASYARNLYTCLRDADNLGLDTVVAILPPEEGLGVAIADRLKRAAGTAEVEASPYSGPMSRLPTSASPSQ